MEDDNFLVWLKRFCWGLVGMFIGGMLFNGTIEQHYKNKELSVKEIVRIVKCEGE